MAKPKSRKNYRDMQVELDVAMARLESGELDVDEALSEYKKVQQLIVAMENYLETAKNSIKHLKK